MSARVERTFAWDFRFVVQLIAIVRMFIDGRLEGARQFSDRDALVADQGAEGFCSLVISFSCLVITDWQQPILVAVPYLKSYEQTVLYGDGLCHGIDARASRKSSEWVGRHQTGEGQFCQGRLIPSGRASCLIEGARRLKPESGQP
ncbi:MAG: hypothetical protein ACK5JE_06210 [Castellaniella sp.]|uniref:hypothetical protein n=1 Tax=Castellaniella sp. TaxID=1955812 RepID=UPI003A87C0AB